MKTFFLIRLPVYLAVMYLLICALTSFHEEKYLNDLRIHRSCGSTCDRDTTAFFNAFTEKFNALENGEIISRGERFIYGKIVFHKDLIEQSFHFILKVNKKSDYFCLFREVKKNRFFLTAPFVSPTKKTVDFSRDVESLFRRLLTS